MCLKRRSTAIVLVAAFGVLGMASTGLATAAVDPPGQGLCNHGNSGRECKPDPQPDRGTECEEHGPNQGGVNEDHCLGGSTSATTAETTTEATRGSTTTVATSVASTVAVATTEATTGRTTTLATSVESTIAVTTSAPAAPTSTQPSQQGGKTATGQAANVAPVTLAARVLGSTKSIGTTRPKATQKAKPKSAAVQGKIHALPFTP